MISVKIAEVKQDIANVSEGWIHEQIRRRQAVGAAVCVRVFVESGNVDLMLSSGECSTSTGRGREASEQEVKIMELWRKFGLDSSPVHGGRLVGFLNQLRDLA